MSSAQFDPCRQWLGIDAVELGDPRRVLGILPLEADPLVVLRAADARLKLLRGIAPGPFDMARKALIKRVEESREAVLAEIAAAPRPPVPVGTVFTMPSRPDGAANFPQPPRGPAVPPVPSFPQPASAWGESAETTSDGGGFVNVKTRPVYRKQSSGLGGLLLLLAVLAAAAGGLAWYLKNGKPLKTTLSKPRGDEKRRVVRDDVDTEPVRQSEPSHEPAPPPEPAAERANERSAEPPTEPPAPSPAAEEPEPTEASEAAAADEADAEALVPFLERALVFLQDEQFDDADDALGQAGDEAMSKAAQDRLAQWQSLVTYARGFADLRDKALAAARPGLEYEIDGKRVAIVEIDDTKVIYRFAGKNKTIPRSKIPGKLLLAILKGWLNRKPANQLYLGAYHVTKPEPDLEKAREAWQLAERGGADASELLPLLDDPVLVKAAGGDQ